MGHAQNGSVKDATEAISKELFPIDSKKSSHAEKYLDKVWDIRTSDAANEGTLAFMARCFIQATLPHSDPGLDEDFWARRNGNFTLEINASKKLDPLTQQKTNIGLPYGSIPRLLLAWMTTEAIRSQSPELLLGKSLSEFMDKLGLIPSGGKKGDITRLKNQAYKLFRAQFTLTHIKKDGGIHEKDLNISSERLLFWNPKRPEQGAFWESSVLLTPEFYELLTQNPAPLDLRALRALKASSLALDVYMWLSHRTFYLDKPQQLSWNALAGQLGSDYKEIKVFRHYVKKVVLKIKAFWPDLNANFDDPDIITLYPSKPIISTKGI